MGQILTKSGERSRAWRDKCRAARKCTRCGVNDPQPAKDVCKGCAIKYSEENKRCSQKVKDEVFAVYGGYTCACCGFTDTHEFFCIDHVNGDGSKHKRSGRRLKGVSLYRWLKDNGYPEGFQVLCGSCSQAKADKKECPHQTRRQEGSKESKAFPLAFPIAF